VKPNPHNEKNLKTKPEKLGLEPARKFKVLFVDDSMAFLETFTELCAVFSNQTWGIECATSVDRALAILQETPVDLVVLDIRMPMVDGLQLLGIIHRRYPGMKIAVMTGNATESKRADALANGAELFIEKPVTPEGIKSVFNLLNDLVSWSRHESPGTAAPPESVEAPLPEKTGEPVAPDDDFVVVATYDGKWNSVNKEKE
jgi:CheY-like chemotaxis protein